MKSEAAAALPERRAFAMQPMLGALGMLGLTLLLLIVLQPFAAGYGNHRLTIGEELMLRWKDPTWQHGALAPLIALWLIWTRRADLAKLPCDSWRPGWLVILGACLLYFAGYKANNFYLGAAGIQFLLAGWTLTVLGRQAARHLIFPWLLLIFMWPLVFLEGHRLDAIDLAFHPAGDLLLSFDPTNRLRVWDWRSSTG